MLTRRDIDQVISKVTTREAAPVTGSSYLGQLLDVKDRARPAAEGTLSPLPSASERPAASEAVTAKPRRSARPTTISAPPAPKPKAPERAEPAPGEGTLASRLLERRRKAEDRPDDKR